MILYKIMPARRTALAVLLVFGVLCLSMEIVSAQTVSEDSLKRNRKNIYYRTSVFKKNVLMVSNIRFCREVLPPPAGSASLEAVPQILPLETSALSKNLPVIAYYEIYNLQADSLGTVRYRVQFVVLQSGAGEPGDGPDKKGNSKYTPANSLSLEHQITSKDSRQANYTQIDLSHLEDGMYEFMIVVSDMNASQNAVGQRRFSLTR